MLVCFSFRAKPGREQELEQVLNNPEVGRGVAKALGATRNLLFFREGRMVRVLEFPEGVRPRSLADLAQEDPAVGAFLRRVGSLAEDGFDLDTAGSLEAFNQRHQLPVLYDVRT